MNIKPILWTAIVLLVLLNIGQIFHSRLLLHREVLSEASVPWAFFELTLISQTLRGDTQSERLFLCGKNLEAAYFTDFGVKIEVGERYVPNLPVLTSDVGIDFTAGVSSPIRTIDFSYENVKYSYYPDIGIAFAFGY